jgi:hypothetical protein
MLQYSVMRPRSTSILLVVAALVALWIAADGRHHWDEPGYLYAGAYPTTAEILDGQVQPSGIPHFMQGRILHVLVVKGVMNLAGSSAAGFRAMIALDLVLLAASVVLLFRILAALLPSVRERSLAAVLMALSPVVLYLAFRTLADTESLLAALVATLALVRIAQGGGAWQAAIAAFALAVAALAKNQMAIMPAAGWAALCLVPFGSINRRRLALVGAACGAASVAVAIGLIHLLGIGTASYIASYMYLADSTVPVVAKVLNVGTELGAIWILLPFALITRRRRELLAFGLWFLLAMAPFVLLLPSIEARHVAVNLVAAGGLAALALEGIAQRWRRWQTLSPGRRAALGSLAFALLLGSNALVLAIMPHRVDTTEMRAMLDRFDARYGPNGYVLLTAAGYTDFQMIRVLWPDVNVRDASTDEISVHAGARSRRDALDAWLGGRYHDSIRELHDIGNPIVYMGYRQTFAAKNLRAIVSVFSAPLADRLLGKVELVDRLFSPSTAWLWESPDVELKPIEQIGHYHAFEVQLAPATP